VKRICTPARIFNYPKWRHGLFDLGAVTTLSMIGRLPYSKMILVWALLIVILVALFLVTHPSLN